MSAYSLTGHSGSSPGDGGDSGLISGASGADSTGAEGEPCSSPGADEVVVIHPYFGPLGFSPKPGGLQAIFGSRVSPHSLTGQPAGSR